MSKYPREILESYVRDDKGVIYQLVPHKIDGYLHLRRGNNYRGVVKKEIQQNIVKGDWRFPNEHELSKFLKEDNQVLHEITQLILKRVLLTQLLIEVDDELIPHFEDDNRARNLIQKSQGHLDRKNKLIFAKIFSEDEQIAQSMMKAIDHFLTTVSKKKPDQLYRIADLILRAEEDNSLYDPTITLTKLK